jgi:tight adherence protein C
LAFVIGAFILVALFGGAYAVYSLTAPTRTSGDRIRDLTGQDVREDRQRDEAVERIAERLSKLANPTDEEERNKMKTLLVQAGYTSRHALEVFNAARAIAAVLIPLVIVPIMGGGQFGMKMVVWVVISAAIGYYAPMAIVSSQMGARQKKLMAPFPDALDLLVSSVEAGLGLDAAFRRVSEEMEAAAPELSREFQIVNREISAGVTRVEALKHLGHRTGLDEINSLVNMLAQADRFGTSVARSLRVHSSLTRQKRMARAEEEAAKVSPKLTVIMILFLLPCLMVVLLGPAAINIKHALIDPK